MRPTSILPTAAALGALALGAAPAAHAVDDPVTTFAGKTGEATSHTCRSQGVEEDSCNQVPVGKHPSQRAVAAYADSWTHEALTLQFELAGDVPFVDAPWVGTHNSYNSLAYGYTPSRSDSNQQLTIADQLAVDVRSVEVDIHWFNGQPRTCHATGEHAGCSTEGPVGPILDEIAAFLDEPGNEDQVVLLYLEDHIRNTQGYDEVTAELERAFGEGIYRSPGGDCSPTLPLTLTRDDVLAAGARVVIVASGCGGGTPEDGATAWSQMVFDWSGGTVQHESRPRGFQDFPDCGPDFTRAQYDSRMIRYFEDSTFVTSTGSTVGAAGTDDGLTPATTAAMMRCGVDLTGFDQLLPDDGRLEASVWSWAEGEPDGSGACAVQRGADGRWETAGCASAKRPAACRTADGDWLVTAKAVKRKQASRACAKEGAAFAVPRTGHENALLYAATPETVESTWLGYRVRGGGWRAADAR